MSLFLRKTAQCSDSLTFHYGLPTLARSNLIDFRQQIWMFGTFVSEDLTFMKAATKTRISLIKPIDLIQYENDKLWAKNKLPYDTDFASLQPKDIVWKQLIDAYKRLLGSCTYQCNKDSDCKYGQAALKFLDWNQQTDSDHTDADIVETFKDQDARSRLIFKCYKINDDDTSEPILLDPKFTLCDTYQWKASGATKNDPNMVFSHYWKNDPNKYEPEGYCEECTLKYGLPAWTFHEPLLGWNTGTFASDDLIMREQASTRKASVLLSPRDLIDYVKEYRMNNNLERHDFPEAKIQVTLPADHWTWSVIAEAYKALLRSCEESCKEDDNCHFAYAATKYVWDQGSGKLGKNALLDQDIIESNLTKNNTVFKCYGLPYDRKQYYRAVGMDNSKNNTTQFKAKDTKYNTTDLDILFSHFWVPSSSATTTSSSTPMLHGQTGRQGHHVTSKVPDDDPNIPNASTVVFTLSNAWMMLMIFYLT